MVLLVIVVPLSFSIIGGFRSNAQLAADPVGLPDPWVFTNYQTTLTDPSFYQWVRNSVLIAPDHHAPGPARGVPGRVRDRPLPLQGPRVHLRLFTLGLLFPSTVAILPLFITLRQTGLLNSPLGIALPQAAFGLPLSIVILARSSAASPETSKTPPPSTAAARSAFYWSVMLPLSRPVLSTIAVLTVVRELERLPPPAPGPDPARAMDAPARHQQHLCSIRDRHRDDPGLHHAGDDPGPDLLLHRPASDSERAHRGRVKG